MTNPMCTGQYDDTQDEDELIEATAAYYITDTKGGKVISGPFLTARAAHHAMVRMILRQNRTLREITDAKIAHRILLGGE